MPGKRKVKVQIIENGLEFDSITECSQWIVKEKELTTSYKAIRTRISLFFSQIWIGNHYNYTSRVTGEVIKYRNKKVVKSVHGYTFRKVE